MYMLKSKGPRIDPCGTPVFTDLRFDLCVLYLTNNSVLI